MGDALIYRPGDVNLYTIGDIINTLSQLFSVFGEYSMEVFSRGGEVHVFANAMTPWGGVGVHVCVWVDSYMEMLRGLDPRRGLLARFEAWINVSWWTAMSVGYRDVQWRPSLLDVLRRVFGLLVMAVGVYR